MSVLLKSILQATPSRFMYEMGILSLKQLKERGGHVSFLDEI